MPQGKYWYRDREEGSDPSFGERIQRLMGILSHPKDAWLVMRILSWAFLLPILKRLVPLKKLSPWMWSEPGSSQDPDYEQKLSTMVRWIYIFIFDDEKSCLERSLLLYRYLSRINRNPQLITGMRRTEAGTWKGHAWIELDGKPFQERTAHIQDFRPMMVFGPNGSMKVLSDSAEKTQ
jgi:hypothetical protein